MTCIHIYDRQLCLHLAMKIFKFQLSILMELQGSEIKSLYYCPGKLTISLHPIVHANSLVVQTDTMTMLLKNGKCESITGYWFEILIVPFLRYLTFF